MTYSIAMHATDIDLKIPLTALPSLLKTFTDIHITNNIHITLQLSWEEDDPKLTGTFNPSNNIITLHPEQSGTFKNSEDGGLMELLTTYNGSGTVQCIGEDSGDESYYKFTKGIRITGKITY